MLNSHHRDLAVGLTASSALLLVKIYVLDNYGIRLSLALLHTDATDLQAVPLSGSTLIK